MTPDKIIPHTRSEERQGSLLAEIGYFSLKTIIIVYLTETTFNKPFFPPKERTEAVVAEVLW